MEVVSALQLAQSKRPETLSFGCEALDDLVGSGLPLGGIVEVSGAAGAGKTQLSLQLLLRACLPVEEGGCGGNSLVLICGEGPFPSKRFAELSRTIAASSKCGVGEQELMGKVGVHVINSPAEQEIFITAHLPRLVEENSIKFVVIDSISSLYRSDMACNSVSVIDTRSKMLMNIARKMKGLSHTFGCTFFVTNQLSGSAPALGLLWSSCLDTRLLLERGVKGSRNLSVLFSSCLPYSKLTLTLTDKGFSAAW